MDKIDTFAYIRNKSCKSGDIKLKNQGRELQKIFTTHVKQQLNIPHTRRAFTN